MSLGSPNCTPPWFRMNHWPVDGRYTAMSAVPSPLKSAWVDDAVLKLSDQHSRLPVSPANASAILSFHVPLAAAPDLPLNVASGCSGRKLPVNGAEPLRDQGGAESSNVVLDVSGLQALP